MRHHAQLIFVLLVEMGLHHVVQSGLELLVSGDRPSSASQSAGITGVSHCAQPPLLTKAAASKSAFALPYTLPLSQPLLPDCKTPL